MVNDSPLAYTVGEAAQVLRVAESTIYRWIAQDVLKTIKIGGRRLVPAKVIKAVLEKGAS